jgi:putative ABC transport system permease protein
MAWIVSTEGSTGIAGELRRAVAEIDPSQRVLRLRTMDEIVASTTATPQFDAWLFGMFAGLALALAAIGVYGLLSFSVAQRRQEIGIRMALGASRADVSKLVLRQGIALTIIGLGLGLAGALFLGRWLSSLLYGVRFRDPFSFVAVSLVLLSVGLIASYIPARRAMKVDPMEALRYE